MLTEFEIRARLEGVVDRQGMAPERDRVARYAARLFTPEVRKMIQEELRAAKAAAAPKGG